MTMLIRGCASGVATDARAGASWEETPVRRASGGKNATAVDSRLRTVVRFRAERLETVSLLFYRVVIGVVVIAVLRDFPAWIVQDGADDSCLHVDQLLVGPLGRHAIGLAGTDNQQYSISQGRKNPRVGRSQHRRRIEYDEVEVLGELLQQYTHSNSTQQIRCVRRQGTAGEYP